MGRYWNTNQAFWRKHQWMVNLQTYLLSKNGKNAAHFVAAIFWKDQSQYRAKLFPSLNFRFFLIVMVYRLKVEPRFHLTDLNIWKNKLSLNESIEFCRGKMTILGWFLHFGGQKVRFLIWKWYENLWFSENKNYIQAFAKGISP